jgi:hypothetical protein
MRNFFVKSVFPVSPKGAELCAGLQDRKMSG